MCLPQIKDNMRLLRIFFLFFQDTITGWSRSIVWLMIPFINGGFFMLFWHAAYQTNKNVLPGWDIDSIMTYYLLLIIVATFLHSHIEEKLEIDIRQGHIAQYLLKPYHFYTAMFLHEFPYRLVQGGYALLFYIVFAFFFPQIRLHFVNIESVLLVICIVILGLFLAHTYKMILGILTFWTKDNKGIQDTSQVLILFFAGYNLPLIFLPTPLATIAFHLPFAYFIYFPIVSLQGKLTTGELLSVILVQSMWLVIFVLSYKVILKRGLKKFTAVGQ